MSQPAWRGGATAVSEVDTFTPASVTTSDVNKLIAVDENGALIGSASFTVGGTQTAAAVVTGLSASWAGNSTLAAIATFSGSTTAILTAATAGIPFHVSSTCTGSGTLTRAATTPNAGPNDWNTAANWTTGVVPVAADTVTIDGRGGSTSANAILYGLDQSAVTVTALRHYKSAPPVGTNTFALKLSATTAEIGLPSNDGASPSGQLISLNTGTNATTTNVYDSPNTGSGGLAPVLLQGNHASNALNVYGGIVGAGTVVPGGTNTYTAIVVSNGVLTTGTATSFLTAVVNGGRVEFGLAAAGTGNSLVINKGNVTVKGATKMGTVTLNGGDLYYNIRISGDDNDVLTMDGGNLWLTGNSAAFNTASLAVKKGGIIRTLSATQFTATAISIDPTNKSNLQVLIAA
jgi:hypothetical protein